MNIGPNWFTYQQKMMAQQQQNMIIQNNYPLYLQYCQINGLVVGHPNSVNLFCQYYLSQPQQPNPLPQPPSLQPPQFFQPQQQQYPQPQPQPQQSYINNPLYLPGNNLQELIPRSDETLYINRELANLPNMINVIFKATSGLNVVVVVNKNSPMFDMFKLYMNKLGLPLQHLSGNLQFLHAGQRLNPYDNTPVYFLFKNNQSIVVYDERSIVGAFD